MYSSRSSDEWSESASYCSGGSIEQLPRLVLHHIICVLICENAVGCAVVYGAVLYDMINGSGLAVVIDARVSRKVERY